MSRVVGSWSGAIAVVALSTLVLPEAMADAESLQGGADELYNGDFFESLWESTDLIQVPTSDGRWMYELPAGEQGVSYREDEIGGWVLERRLEYRDSALFVANRSGVWSEVVPPEPQQTLLEQLRGTRRVDRYGRVWVLDTVDEETVAEAVQAYEDAVAIEEFAGSQEEWDAYLANGEPVIPAPSSYPERTGWEYLRDTVWHSGDCSDLVYDVWDDDDRFAPSSLNGENRAAALHFVNSDNVSLGLSAGAGSCSATLVDSDTILTAAHCICHESLDDPSCAPDVSEYEVCTGGNSLSDSSCVGGSGFQSVALPPTWSGSPDPNDDYAVIKLTTGGANWLALLGKTDTMSMSAASETYQLQFDVESLGHPALLGTSCSDFNPNASTPGPVWPGMYHNRLYQQYGTLAGFDAARINTLLDTAEGQSGSSFFYTPNGTTYSTNGFITGVVSGNNGFWIFGFTNGPKVSRFRAWVAAQL